MNIFTETEDVNSESIPKPIDAIVEVSISNNKLQASLNIKAPQHGGLEHNFPSIRKSLSSKGITYGINTKKLLTLCENPVYDEEIIIAEGLAPISGIDGSFDLKFNTDKNSKFVTKEDGSVDFYNLDNIENVKKDQLLCSIILPIEGKDGMSVLGKTITCPKGKPVPLLSGKNTLLNKEGTEIRSAIDGQVNYIHGKIKVDETFFIKGDVDASTGNINVVGNVVIGGKVRSGFIVEATGNIQIRDGISSATLIAGGNIVLKSGIIVGSITCQGDLCSKFIENCKVNVQGHIKTDYIMNSHVKCGKSLQAINSISKIVGGNYLVAENIEANIIGSPANVKTYLEIGIDPDLINRRKELMEEIDALETQSKSLQSLIPLLQKLEEINQLTPDKKDSLEKSLFSHESILETLENKNLELNELKEIINSKITGKVICKGILYSGTSVKIASAKKKITDTMFNTSLYYLDEEIHIGKA